MVLNWYRWRSEMYPCTPSSFRIRITNILLASCNVCNIRMWLRQQFFRYWKDNNIQTFKTLKNKLDELTDVIDVGSLSLESPSIATSIQYVCYLYDENKSSSSVNELRYWMFTKKNLSGDCLPPNLDALVLPLRRVLIFFHWYLFNTFSKLVFFIYQKYKV